MGERGVRSARHSSVRGGSAAYELPDRELRAYDHGLGTLRVDGELQGHLASIIGRMQSSEPWPWFVVVWADGTKESSFEDYGPGWWTVRELDAGRLEWFERSVSQRRRFFGWQFVSVKRGRPCTFDFAWLAAGEAKQKWNELGLADSDF